MTQSVSAYLTPTPEIHPSRAAVEVALAFYRALGAQDATSSSHGALAKRLAAALAAPGRLSSTDFHALVQFGLMMSELDLAHVDAPRCNLGDVVTALIVAAPDAGWTWEPAVDDAVVAKLEVRETSLGIAKNQRANREGWWAHAAHNRTFIRRSIARCSGRRLAVVLGAGQAFDLPLVELAQAFDRLVLVDIDAVALEETAAAVLADPALRRRVELRVADVTGVNRQVLARVDRMVAEARDVEDACERLGASVRSYRLPNGPRLLAPGERADLLVSDCMLSQIAWSQRRYARNVVERRFGDVPEAARPAWALAWQEFELRLQQDHINALPAGADVAVLTSDVAVRSTAVDANGRPRPGSERRLLLSVPTLRDRVPCFLRADAYAAWAWNLLAPEGPHRPGGLYDVEGLSLRP